MSYAEKQDSECKKEEPECKKDEDLKFGIEESKICVGNSRHLASTPTYAVVLV